MAVSWGAVPSDELGWLADDKVCLLGRNWARTADDIRWNYTGSFADADESDASWPADLASDDQDYRQTRSDATASTSYLLFDLGSAGAEIDAVAILNHTINTEGATVALEVADDSTFASNLRAIASSTPSSDKRLVFLDLFHTGSTALRYTGVQYFRLKFTGTTIKPLIGEVVISRRRQMRNNPILPYDNNRLETIRLSSVSLSGVQYHTVLAKGQRVLNAVLPTGLDARVTDMRAFFEGDTDYASRPFLWIDEPSTSPSDAWWFGFNEAVQSGALQGFSRRNWIFSAREKGPNFLASGGL